MRNDGSCNIHSLNTTTGKMLHGYYNKDKTEESISHNKKYVSCLCPYVLVPVSVIFVCPQASQHKPRLPDDIFFFSALLNSFFNDNLLL